MPPQIVIKSLALDFFRKAHWASPYPRASKKAVSGFPITLSTTLYKILVRWTPRYWPVGIHYLALTKTLYDEVSISLATLTR